jgi:Protein of unknown function (DUF3024)
VIDAASERVAAFCAKRSPPEMRSDYRLEQSVRGSSITIVERRPPWNPAFGSEWSSTKIAQLRFDERARRWALFWAGSDDRWHRIDEAQPATDVTPLLAAVDEDRHGVFWG